MKLKIGLGIFIVIAIIFVAKFLTEFINESALANSLTTKIQANTLALSKISQSAKATNSETNAVSSEIIKTQDDINAAGKLIPHQVNPNEVIKEIFAQAPSNKITLVPLSTTAWTLLNRHRNDEMKVFKMEFSVSGSEADVTDFVQWMQDSHFPSLVIENFKISKSTASANHLLVAANINLALYSK